jgi:hypothetical protein
VCVHVCVCVCVCVCVSDSILPKLSGAMDLTHTHRQLTLLWVIPILSGMLAHLPAGAITDRAGGMSHAHAHAHAHTCRKWIGWIAHPRNSPDVSYTLSPCVCFVSIDPVCVYVCMFVFIYLCMNVCMCVCVYVCMYVCVCWTGRSVVVLYWSFIIIGLLTLLLLLQQAYVDALTPTMTGDAYYIGVVLGFSAINIGLAILPCTLAHVVYWWPTEKLHKVVSWFGCVIKLGLVMGVFFTQWLVLKFGLVATLAVYLVLNILALALCVVTTVHLHHYLHPCVNVCVCLSVQECMCVFVCIDASVCMPVRLRSASWLTLLSECAV